MRTGFVLAALALGVVAHGQDRLSTMPRYDLYEKLRNQISQVSQGVAKGRVSGTWAADGTAFLFQREGAWQRFELKSRALALGEAPTEADQAARRGSRRAPERGRQFDTVYSADGKLKAFHRDRNVYLSPVAGGAEEAITTEGNATDRTKFGIASWVYGEELSVREAMWFSPDSKRLAFYFFDESAVKDTFLAMDQTKFQSSLDVEAYPKAGQANPKVELYVTDLATRQRHRVDVDFGPDGAALREYVYEVRWSPDGKELLYHRTNRLQNTMELCAFDPAKGTSRAILRESNPGAWTDNAPPIRWLEDNRRFLWISERNGFRNLYLVDSATGKTAPVTQHGFEVADVQRVDEKAGEVWYTARSGVRSSLMQLHRVRLDGKGDVRLTDPAFNHSVQISPTGSGFVDTFETVDTPPVTVVRDRAGKELGRLGEADMAEHSRLKFQRTRLIRYKAADGVTDLTGQLQVPSDFDPSKRYPVIVQVYAGPESGGGTERFEMPNAITELGFLVADLEGRGMNGRGRAFRNAVYQQLGVVEIDDQAAGARAIQALPYVDPGRIGITGTSYGGYATIMAMLRHPDVFVAGIANSSVTDWRHYDTIYTERYMGLPIPEGNLKGYDAGSAHLLAKNLRGRLLIFYGTADNNVHPSNSLMFAQALNRAGKSYEMMVGPDQGHTAVDFRRTWEFFLDHLIYGRPPVRAAERPLARRTTQRALKALSAR